MYLSTREFPYAVLLTDVLRAICYPFLCVHVCARIYMCVQRAGPCAVLMKRSLSACVYSDVACVPCPLSNVPHAIPPTQSRWPVLARPVRAMCCVNKGSAKRLRVFLCGGASCGIARVPCAVSNERLRALLRKGAKEPRDR